MSRALRHGLRHESATGAAPVHGHPERQQHERKAISSEAGMSCPASPAPCCQRQARGLGEADCQGPCNAVATQCVIELETASHAGVDHGTIAMKPARTPRRRAGHRRCGGQLVSRSRARTTMRASLGGAEVFDGRRQGRRPAPDAGLVSMPALELWEVQPEQDQTDQAERPAPPARCGAAAGWGAPGAAIGCVMRGSPERQVTNW